MPRETINSDNTVTLTFTLAELTLIEDWGDCAADQGDPFDVPEQHLYDRISGLRTELEVNQGANS